MLGKIKTRRRRKVRIVTLAHITSTPTSRRKTTKRRNTFPKAESTKLTSQREQSHIVERQRKSSDVNAEDSEENNAHWTSLERHAEKCIVVLRSSALPAVLQGVFHIHPILPSPQVPPKEIQHCERYSEDTRIQTLHRKIGEM